MTWPGSCPSMPSGGAGRGGLLVGANRGARVHDPGGDRSGVGERRPLELGEQSGDAGASEDAAVGIGEEEGRVVRARHPHGLGGDDGEHVVRAPGGPQVLAQAMQGLKFRRPPRLGLVEDGDPPFLLSQNPEDQRQEEAARDERPDFEPRCDQGGVSRRPDPEEDDDARGGKRGGDGLADIQAGRRGQNHQVVEVPEGAVDTPGHGDEQGRDHEIQSDGQIGLAQAGDPAGTDREQDDVASQQRQDRQQHG